MPDNLTIVLYAIEDVIWNRPTTCSCDTFLTSWQDLPANSRRKAFDLYYQALKDCYYDRTTFGQVVIRAVGEL